MTPATRGAIEGLRYIAGEIADTPFDTLAQLAFKLARQLEDDARSEKPSEAEATLNQIRRLLK